MIAGLSIENYRSFNGKQEISLIPSGRVRTHPDHKEKIKETSFLKYAAIYGAGASGKSSLMGAFSFLCRSIAGGIPIDSMHDFCRLDRENEKRPSRFEIRFSIGGRFYAYGFSVVLSIRTIVEEWLLELHGDGSSTQLFGRKKDQAPFLGAGVSLPEKERYRFHIYSEDFTGYDSILFLTEMNQGKNYWEMPHLLFFQDVYTYLTKNLVLRSPRTMIYPLDAFYDEAALERINALIKDFDTGISWFFQREISLQELFSMLSKPMLKQIADDLRRRSEASKDRSARASYRTPLGIVSIRMEDGGATTVSVLSMKHESSGMDSDFQEESEGTQRLLDLMELLLPCREDTVFLVDDLEQRLHTKMTQQWLKVFMEAHKNHRVQLIFTTGEDSILDQDLFRKDELWLVEKGADGASTLSPLDHLQDSCSRKRGRTGRGGRHGASRDDASKNDLE